MKLIITFLSLFMVAGIGSAQNYNTTKKTFLNDHNGVLKKNSSINSVEYQLNEARENNKVFKDGLTNYYVITKLDSANGGFAYNTPIDIYENNLLIRSINNFSGHDSTPHYTRDNISSSSPPIYEYLYNQENKISETQGYTFDINGQKYLKEKKIYSYTNGKLDSIIIKGYDSETSSLVDFYKDEYEYDHDTVNIIHSYSSPDGFVQSVKYKKVYSDDILMLQERYYFNNSTSVWEKNYISNYYYNSDNLLVRIEYYFVSSFDGTLIPSGKSEYIYNSDKSLKQIISSNAGYSSYSFSNGTEEILSILTPKDQNTFTKNSLLYFNFYSYKSSNLNLLYSIDGGNIWQNIANNISPSEIFTWQIPDLEAESYLIKAEDVNNSEIYDIVYILNYLKTPVTSEWHSTGSLRLTIYNDGYFSKYGDDFNFNGHPNVLYAGGFALLQKPSTLKGSFSRGFDLYDFTNYEPLLPFSSNSNFDQISNCAFIENIPEIGIIVNQQTFSNTGDDFIIIKYRLKNNTNNRIDSLIAGIFMDLDIVNSGANLGGVDKNKNLVYQYDPTDPYYYGMVALQDVYGANVTNFYDGNDVRNSFYTNFTTFGESSLTNPSDYRSFICSGTYTLEANEEKELSFAVVAGESFSDFLNNSEQAKEKYNSTLVNVTRSETIPNAYKLSQNYPNPFNPTTNIEYSIPESGNVELKIFDLLGREVAILVNELKQPGNYEVKFNGSNLASGVYFYRLQAGSFSSTKKFVLMK